MLTTSLITLFITLEKHTVEPGDAFEDTAFFAGV
jgi:hypothetical protein